MAAKEPDAPDTAKKPSKGIKRVLPHGKGSENSTAVPTGTFKGILGKSQDA
jgi:hypothetical protein